MVAKAAAKSITYVGSILSMPPDWPLDPIVGGFKLKQKVIEQWDVRKCEKHIKDLVDVFAVHYTREQVPMALYNECTNFMTKLSFSHDYILDPLDTKRCRQATVKFATHWNFEKNTQ